LRVLKSLFIILCLVSCSLVAFAQGTWTVITNQPPINGACCGLLLTDGSVMVQDNSNGTATNHWWKLTPDITGSYVNGTWSQLADSRSDWGPLFYASAVLEDGRVFAMGGEYNELGALEGFTNKGAIYDPVTNTWANLAAPAGWSSIGDAQCTVFPNGKLMLANPTTSQSAILDPTTLTWTAGGVSGKETNFDEEGWNLLPDGTILTLDVFSTPNAEKYVIANDNWVQASGTAVAFTDSSLGFEMGPAILRYNGQVVQIAANNHTAIYTPPATPTLPGTWTAGPDIPGGAGGADAPACLLTNGNVLFAVSPLPIFSGTPTFYYEFTTANALVAAPSPPNASFENCFTETMLMLPNGQVMLFDTGTAMEFYTPSGSPNSAWRPTITSAPANIVSGQDYTISGTQFNGYSQSSAYGDDWTNATNYPIVRITNNASGHVFYARTHDHSTMAVATGTAIVSTHFVPPLNMEDGPSTITVIANGIPSATSAPTTSHAIYVKNITCPNTTGGGTSNGTINLNLPAPAGGLTVNLSSNNAAAAVPATAFIAGGASSGTFVITGTNNTYVSINATITESFGTESNHTATAKVQPNNRASFVSQVVPTAMVCGQSYPVSVTFKNNGGVTWDTAHSYMLYAANPYGTTRWGLSKMPLGTASVAPGANGTFSMTAIAPSSPGAYNFQWQCYQQTENMFFGSVSTNVVVTATKNADAARYISKTGPLTVGAGADFFVQNTFMNVGTNSWSTSTGYSMMTVNPNNDPTWTATRGYLASGTIAPNANGTFTGSCTAPTTPGVYTMQWEMNRNGTAFGDKSPLLNINVTASADNATYNAETAVPTSIGPSVTFGVTFTMNNVGSATWDNTYSLLPTGSNNFGITGITSASVAPGNPGTFIATFTAPATPGTYTFRWRMAHVTTKFGQSTPLITIVVSADAATYVSRTGPLTVNAGQDFYIQNLMKNTGTTSWSTATGYSMMTVYPANNDATWTATRAYLASGTIAPGATGTFTGSCTAPILPGTGYKMQWQMDKNGVPFGEKSPLLNVIVVQGPDDAQFVSQIGIPTSIVHGTTFTPTITMKNLGTATWGAGYTLNSIGSNTFGIPSINAVSTIQGANDAFSATFTAPATPGTYTFQIRMAHSGVKFGQPGTKVTITVT
jgi:hypothetical protein